MRLLSLFGLRTPNVPTRRNLPALLLTALENRDVPAAQWYTVHLDSSPQGTVGETLASVTSGGLHVDSSYDPDGNGTALVFADNESDAVRTALTGTLAVDLSAVNRPTAEYTFEYDTSSVTAAEHEPFLVLPRALAPLPPVPIPAAHTLDPDTTTAEDDSGVWQIRLEDLAAYPDPADWDYNDFYWNVTVAERAVTHSNPPTANPDSAVVGLNGVVAISPLANDTSNHGSYLTISSAGSDAQHGTVVVADDGRSLVYTPDANFSGTDTFSYTATNEFGESSTSTVTITVYPAPLVTVSGPETELYPADTDPDVTVRYTLTRSSDAASSTAMEYRVTVLDGADFTNEVSSQTLAATFAPGDTALDRTFSLATATTDRKVKIEVLPPAPGGPPAYVVDPTDSTSVFLCAAPANQKMEVVEKADGSMTVTYTVDGNFAGSMDALPLKEFTYQQKDPNNPNGPKLTKKILVAQGVTFKVTNQAAVVSKLGGQDLSDEPVGYIKLLPGALPNTKHDDKSHLMAQMYGGRNDLRNNVPLDFTANQGRMREVENRIKANALALANGASIEVRVLVEYDNKAITAELAAATQANRAPNPSVFRPLAVRMSSNSEILVPPVLPPNKAKNDFIDPVSKTLKTAIITNK